MATVTNTNNWDTVSAIKFKAVNQAIRTQKSSPAAFSGQAGSPFGHKATISANFDDWQLSGGSGALVHMKLPFTAGKAVVSDGSTDLGSGYGIIEVNLQYIPQPGDSNAQSLQVAPDQVVTDVSVTMDDPSLADWALYVQSALLEWLNDNLQEFNHVFAVVNLGAEEGDPTFAWLKPTKVGYAVEARGSNVDDYVFGVLAMTEGREGQALAYQVSPFAIPVGMDAGFLIATERFLEKMFMPGVYLMFAGASADDFDIGVDGTQITNIHELRFNAFEAPTNASGTETKVITDATVAAGNFTLTAFSTTLHFTFTDLNYTWKEGFIVNVNYTGVSGLQLDANNHLLMPETSDPNVTFTVTKTSAQEWKEIGIAIGIDVAAALVAAAIGGVAEAANAARAAARTAAEEVISEAVANAGADASIDGAVSIPLLTPEEQAELRAAQNLQALTDAAAQLANPSALQKFTGFFLRNWKIVLGVVVAEAVGSALGQIPNILDSYAEEGLEHAPTLDKFADEAVSPIQWAQIPSFDLASAALNGPLQLGLKIHGGDGAQAEAPRPDPHAKFYAAALDRAHEGKRGDALLDAPVSALAGVSPKAAEALADIGVETIRQLAENRFVKLAQQLVQLHRKQ